MHGLNHYNGITIVSRISSTGQSRLKLKPANYKPLYPIA